MSDEKSAYIAAKQAQVAEFCGVSFDTVKSWAKQGMPGSPGAYDLSAIVQWLRTKGPWRQHLKVDSDDPLLSDGDSPGLERYRLAKAAIAELDLEERKGNLLSREKVRAILIRWATIIRRLGERLAKHFGNQAAGMVNDSLGECQAVIEYEFGSSESTDDGTEAGAFLGAVTVESADSPTDEPVG
jgi:phage terminase Nu1 subunit (DNA packaging protein)